MKKILTILLIVIFISTPYKSAFANQTNDSEEELTQQIVAILGYIKRNFLPQPITAISDSDLRESIKNANTWFINSQEENGHFRYEYVPYEDEYLDDDNIVRQAGALYSLGEISRRDKEHAIPTKDTIINAISFFESISITDSRPEYNFTCIANSSSSSKCALGATSLALSGMLGYLEAYPEEQSKYDDLVESYITYILKMKKSGEGFRNTHVVSRTSQKDRESAFSNGEALLTLVRYYKWNPREDVKEVIDATFLYLSKQPYETALYLWIMAALKDMHVLWEKEEYITYGKDFTDWRINRYERSKGTRRNYCASTEGLISAYSLLENYTSNEYREMLRGELSFWNNKNKILQLSKGDNYRVSFEDGDLLINKLSKPEIALGGFLTAETEPTQRIDFTQHCVTGYVQTLVDINGGSL